jgi:hypothetical protein
VGQLFAIASTGGATAFSSSTATATLTVMPVHHAPTWSGSGAALTPVLPGATNPPGDTVASIFGSYFNDSNLGTAVGIAVSGLTGTTDGTWQYALGGSNSWQNFGTLPAGQARLLSANDRIRFVPNPGFLGTVALTAYAWDASTGTDGGTGAVSGSTALSSTTLTATCLVNTAPTLAP